MCLFWSKHLNTSCGQYLNHTPFKRLCILYSFLLFFFLTGCCIIYFPLLYWLIRMKKMIQFHSTLMHQTSSLASLSYFHTFLKFLSTTLYKLPFRTASLNHQAFDVTSWFEWLFMFDFLHRFDSQRHWKCLCATIKVQSEKIMGIPQPPAEGHRCEHHQMWKQGQRWLVVH